MNRSIAIILSIIALIVFSVAFIAVALIEFVGAPVKLTLALGAIIAGTLIIATSILYVKFLNSLP